MRTEEEVEREEEGLPTSASGRKKHAGTHHGVQGRRILPFPRTHIIPCFLHCLSAIVKKLFKLLQRDLYLSTEVMLAWERIFATRRIKLSTNPEKTLFERISDARWGRPEWLAVLQYHTDFINAMKENAGYNTPCERA
jgi:hypothetical protein